MTQFSAASKDASNACHVFYDQTRCKTAEVFHPARMAKYFTKESETVVSKPSNCYTVSHCCTNGSSVLFSHYIWRIPYNSGILGLTTAGDL